MLRARAVRSLLVGDIAALRIASDDAEAQRAELRKAKARALRAVLVDWVAITVLFVLHRAEEPFLWLGADPRTIFTIGILAVAVHSGFRLGQWEKLKAVERAYEELSERESGS